MNREFCSDDRYKVNSGKQMVDDQGYWVPSHLIAPENNLLMIQEFSCGDVILTIFLITINDNQDDKSFIEKIVTPKVIEKIKNLYLAKHPIPTQSFAESIKRKQKLSVQSRSCVRKLSFLDAKNLNLWLIQFGPFFLKTHRRRLDYHIEIDKFYENSNPRPSQISFHQIVYQVNGWKIEDVQKLITLTMAQLPRYQLCSYQVKTVASFMWTSTNLFLDNKQLLFNKYVAHIAQGVSLPFKIVEIIFRSLPTDNFRQLLITLVEEQRKRVQRKQLLKNQQQHNIFFQSFKIEFSEKMSLPLEMVDTIYDFLDSIKKEQLIRDLISEYVEKVQTFQKSEKVISPEEMFEMVKIYLACYKEQVFKPTKNELKSLKISAPKIEPSWGQYMINIYYSQIKDEK